MATTSKIPTRGSGRWSVSRCSHGCFHVDLGQVTLKLSPRELHAIVQMLGDAYVRYGVEEATQQAEAAGIH